MSDVSDSESMDSDTGERKSVPPRAPPFSKHEKAIERSFRQRQERGTNSTPEIDAADLRYWRLSFEGEPLPPNPNP